MKRAFALTVLLGLSCVRERVIVVHEPGPGQTTEPQPPPPDGNTIATDDRRNQQIASDEPDWGIKNPSDSREYARVVAKVANMVQDGDLANRVRRRSLSLVNVMWEDTGRAQGSSLGPNISDLTLQVRRRDESGQFQSSIMPVIRFPNFTDRTGDVASPTGSSSASATSARQPLRSVPLTDVLRDSEGVRLDAGQHPRQRQPSRAARLALPRQRAGGVPAHPEERQGRVQPGALQLPIGAAARPQFSRILVTRAGNEHAGDRERPEERDRRGMGQELYFNNQGQRAAFTAERKSDVEAAHRGAGRAQERGRQQRARRRARTCSSSCRSRSGTKIAGYLGGAIPKAAKKPSAMPAHGRTSSSRPPGRPWPQPRASDVEQAVLGHGPNLGPFNEGHRLRFERDPSFPIRITVQFYKATSNGVASDIDLDSIARSIGSVYEHADFVGSLVLPGRRSAPSYGLAEGAARVVPVVS